MPVLIITAVVLVLGILLGLAAGYLPVQRAGRREPGDGDGAVPVPIPVEGSGARRPGEVNRPAPRRPA